MPGSTGQLKALWNQILNGTAPAGAASATGDLGQMVKEAIARLDKLVGTTDLGAMTASATGSLGEQLAQIQALLDQVMGTTNTAAVSADAAGSVVERVKYLIDNLPKGVRKLQGSGTLVMPANSYGVTLTAGAVAWTNGAYAQVLASTSEADYLLGVIHHNNTSGFPYEMDLATGGAGAETVINTHASHIASNIASTSYIFPAPLAVAASTRIAARMRDSNGGDTMSIRLIYCKQTDLVAL